jgi:pSer/pThr/pTyr-binding forkhead associated (FHA) protein/predicted Ser/Thr protein kinase
MSGEQLRVTEGTDHGRVLSVETELLIGRSSPVDAGGLGGDPEISRRHARLFRGDGGRLQIEDLGSANGTFVNGERIDAPRTLTAGDVVRFGQTALRVEPSAAPAAPGPELAVTAGGSAGLRLTFLDELLIGREVGGEGHLSEDPELSRRHARFARDEHGQLTVEDLGSANGTFVNGQRLTDRRALSVGDVVRVGSTTLQVTGAEPVRPAAEPVRPEAEVVRPAAEPVRPEAEPVRPAAEAVRPAAEPVRPPVEAPPPAGRRSDLPLGAVFAGCRVEAVLNHGDMGVVYRAEELALRRPVALKLILPDYSRDDRFRERFRRESKIAASIDHQNVIPIYDAGEEQGLLYIMMRLVEGTDLRHVIAAERWLEPRRAARIVRQVGVALDAAHARGMVHRDVKPTNVLLGRRDHVYLTDFGLAKSAASREALTRGQTVVARVEYLAPEQVLGQRVDARTDVYALGCLLFEALTGQAPFAEPTGGAGALAHLDAPPPSPLQLRPDLPPAFDEVVRRAMAKDPGERYPSAGDLGQAALAAAGGLRRPHRESVVATGEAAPGADDRLAAATAASAAASVAESAPSPRHERLRWAVALSGLVAVAAGMVAALHGISTL